MIPYSVPYVKIEERDDGSMWMVERNAFGDIIFQWRFK